MKVGSNVLKYTSPRQVVVGEEEEEEEDMRLLQWLFQDSSFVMDKMGPVQLQLDCHKRL